MSSKKNKVKTVSDNISEKFLPKALVDPENDPESLVRIADFDEDEDADKFPVTAKPSEIRKRNTQLLSEFSSKYKGKVTSRKELDEDGEDSGDGSDLNASDEDDSSDLDSELEEYRRKLKEMKLNQKNDDDSESDLDEEEQSDEDDIDDDDDSSDYNITGNLKSGKRDKKSNSSNKEYSDEQEGSDEKVDYTEEDKADGKEEEDDSDEASEDEEDSDSSADLVQAYVLPESNAKAELKKGYAVQNQLKIWEKLLEIRIHSHKIANKANCLPPPTTFNELCDKDENFYKLAEETASNVERLLENMLEIQYKLASQYSEMKDIIKDHRKRPSSTDKPLVEPPIKRFAETLAENHESFKPYRNSTLQKWDDRVKVMNPTHKKGRNYLKGDENDVLQRIEFVLQTKNNLIAKSRTVKGNYKLFGYKEEGKEESAGSDGEKEEKQQISPEIYDDTDFYHQQLRELIEYKSNTTSNPSELNKQFAELQKLRQKMKKKVDTRASKGRKIRYVVHNKLVNFMPPNDTSEWTDESKTELYRSLFAT